MPTRNKSAREQRGIGHVAQCSAHSSAHEPKLGHGASDPDALASMRGVRQYVPNCAASSANWFRSKAEKLLNMRSHLIHVFSSVCLSRVDVRIIPAIDECCAYAYVAHYLRPFMNALHRDLLSSELYLQCDEYVFTNVHSLQFAVSHG